MRLAFAVVGFVAIASRLVAAEPTPEPGRKMLDDYLRLQTRRIADTCLADLTTRAEWEKKRPELRRQFLEMMGLWPLPPRTDLKPVVTGKVDAEKFTIEKLHFLSMPGLYVTANLYIPKQAQFPAPTVLYVCGHSGSLVDKVQYGSKVSYQHHPAWLAEHGYVCLILDTLQYGEIEGIHHGTHPGQKRNWWWWHTLGYSPAGVECWNAMRALDYLETRPEVDAKRFGVTGRSGGGAYSWWLAAADDRPQCIIPVAGIADLWAHVVEGVAPRFKNGVISGHCDCMYFTNTYQWDFPLVAALCAPRPLLLGNSDLDDIFPVPGYRRLAEKVKKVYALYGAEDKFALLETAGPHKDTRDLRLGAFAWLNRWLKNDTKEVTEREYQKLSPQQLKVFERLPSDAINATIQETFVPSARLDLPASAEEAREWLKTQAPNLKKTLLEKVFRGWPTQAPPARFEHLKEMVKDGVRLRTAEIVTEPGITLPVLLIDAARPGNPARVIVNVVDDAGWRESLAALAGPFQPLLGENPSGTDPAQFGQLRKIVTEQNCTVVIFSPRGYGPTRWAEPGSAEDAHIRRRFVLLGQTLDGQRVWDVRRLIQALDVEQRSRELAVVLQARGDLAGVALYAALFEPAVTELELTDLPATHRQGPTLLNVRRYLDVPQAIVLAFPRKIQLKGIADGEPWAWATRFQNLLGQEYVKIR